MRDQKIILPLLVGLATAGPLAYGVCQAGCSAVVMRAQRRRPQSLPAILRSASARRPAQLLDFVPVFDIDIVGRLDGISNGKL
ncbi:hypothetical protein IF2G_10978 [Cordyceps javanica]|nr:hypothetical protein IF2G_10978 [Cordyceps javanica]